jgi:hypothetical protein
VLQTACERKSKRYLEVIYRLAVLHYDAKEIPRYCALTTHHTTSGNLVRLSVSVRVALGIINIDEDTAVYIVSCAARVEV